MAGAGSDDPSAAAPFSQLQIDAVHLIGQARPGDGERTRDARGLANGSRNVDYAFRKAPPLDGASARWLPRWLPRARHVLLHTCAAMSAADASEAQVGAAHPLLGFKEPVETPC
jgi:hypothetical protein